MTSEFNELVDETIKRIEAIENRKRSRSISAKLSFSHAVYVLLLDLWKSIHSIPRRECKINKRAGYYSENPRYRDPLLTFRQMIAAFNGLLHLDFIEVTHEGVFDRESLQGFLTTFAANNELLERLHSLDEHPAVFASFDPANETIVLRDIVDGQRKEIDYDDTPKTEEYRSNLLKVNSCLQRHWIDLELKDEEFNVLASKLDGDENKNPIDLSARNLVRIFSNGSFKEGGRFYRGWWQNVPSDYRKHITIDMKKTCEYDFSQLNPHMLYFAYHKELGSEDAYGRVLDGEHRDLVKSAFNAMIQADRPLNSCPRDIDPRIADMSWTELRDRIISAHKPIEDLFFRGEGSRLQFVDSCICECVMLQFAKIDAPAYPIHDSFIMHHGYGGELEESMRRSFYEIFENDIPVKHEIVEWRTPTDCELGAIDVDTILEKESKYSNWFGRNQAWLNRELVT
jgi:hypothetical protein